MIPSFEPASYPGPRPPGPVLVHRGAVQPLELTDDVTRPFRLRPDRHGAVEDVAVLRTPAEIRWSVAYGSNASPGRLVGKGLDRAGAMLLPARLLDHAPVFEHRRTGYGAVPLTLVHAPGTVVDTWVLGLPPGSMPHLDLTEGRVPSGASTARTERTERIGSTEPYDEPVDGKLAPPGTYQLAAIGEVAVADRFVLERAFAYLPGPDTRIQVTDAGAWRTWPDHTQAEAAAHLDRRGADRPAPVVRDPVLGDWPPTPLSDPPLFVYGTLRPGGAAHHLVADLVEDAGQATVAGTLYDTGAGYPAASFDPDERPGRRVHGWLLRPRDGRAAAELLRRCDHYEGLPPYERIAVRAHAPDGPRWALAYGWRDGTPPGTRSRTGRW